MLFECLSSPIIKFLSVLMLTGKEGREWKFSEQLAISDHMSWASHT